MSEKNDLYEGLTIMSPQEMESSLGGAKDVNEEVVENTSEKPDNFLVVPGETSEATGEVENEVEEQDDPGSNDPREVKYKALLSELVEEGIISVEDEEELKKAKGSLKTIKEYLNKTVEKTLNEKQDSWKKSFTGAKKKFLDIEDAFTDADHAIMVAQRLDYLESLDTTSIRGNVELQKQLFAESLRVKGYSPEKIGEEIQDAEALGKLEKKALSAYPELMNETKFVVEKARESKEAMTQKQIDDQNAMFDNLITTIDTRDHLIEGLPLNKISRDKLKSNIINPVYTDPKSGKEYNSLMYKQSKNPTEFEILLNHYDTLGLFNIDKDGKFKPDISKLKKIAKTAAITELDKVIDAENKGVGRNTSLESSKKTSDILEKLERIYK
jgi:broad-specificity NMP kinase